MKAGALRREGVPGKVWWGSLIALSFGLTAARGWAEPVTRGDQRAQPAREPTSQAAVQTAGLDEANGIVIVGTIVNVADAAAFCTDDSYLQLVKLSGELGVTIDSYGARVYESTLPKVPVPLEDGSFVILVDSLEEGRYVVAFQGVNLIPDRAFDGRQLKPWLRSKNRYVTIEIGPDTQRPQKIDLGEVRFPGTKKQPVGVQ